MAFVYYEACPYSWYDTAEPIARFKTFEELKAFHLRFTDYVLDWRRVTRVDHIEDVQRYDFENERWRDSTYFRRTDTSKDALFMEQDKEE